MSESEMAAKNVSKGTSLVNYCEAVLFHLRLGPEGRKEKGLISFLRYRGQGNHPCSSCR